MEHKQLKLKWGFQANDLKSVLIQNGAQQISQIMASEFGLNNILLNRAVDEIIYDEDTGVTTIHAYSTLPGEKDEVVEEERARKPCSLVRLFHL